MSVKTYVAIRTHTIGRPELRLLNRLNIFFDPDRIVFAVDETRKPLATPAPYRKAPVDRAFLEERRLYADHPRIGWLCGDYFLYALLQACPDADRFWLIEPDVHLGLEAARTLFDATEAMDDDLLGCRFGKADPNWAWFRHGQAVGAVPHKCLFSMVRVTRRAIEHLLQARQRLYQQLRNKPNLERLWPNDESFVATTLANDPAFRCGDLAARIESVDFTRFSAIQIQPLDFAESGPPNAIMHPVLADEQLLAKLKVLVRTAMGRSDVQPILARLAATSQPHLKAGIEAAVSETLRTWIARVLDERPPAHPGAPAPAPAAAPAAARPREGDVRAEPPGAAFRVRTRIAPQSVGLSRTTDFEVVAQDGQHVQDAAFAPYQVDPATRSILMLETPRAALGEPFFYQAQRRHARWARMLPIDACPPSVPEEVTSALVFSIGRCGSTLFSQIAAASGYTSVSECDVFSGLPQLPEADRDRVFAFTVQSLATFCEVPYAQLVFKFRSDASALAQRAVRLFPNARLFLIVRDVEPWSRSFIAKFDWTSQQLLNTLMNAVRSARACIAAGGKVVVLRYEDFQHAPEKVFQVLNPQRAPDADEIARLRLLAQQDSQEGAGIDTRVDAAEVDRRVREFLDLWAAQKPREELAALGLDL